MENLYNLIPYEEKKPPKQKRYVSQYAEQARQEYKTGKQSGKLMGPPKKDGDKRKVLKKGTGGAGMGVAVPPQRKEKPTTRKPAVPRHNEHSAKKAPVKRDFLKQNAQKAIQSKPKKKEDPKSFTQRKSFGYTPNYLHKRKQEEEFKKQQYAEYLQSVEEADKRQQISPEEKQDLLMGLKENWSQLHKEFQGLSVVVDTAAKRARKKGMEEKLAELEADIELLESHDIIYVTA